MKIITEDVALKCTHRGVVRLEPVQDWVTVGGRRVLIEPDPEDRDIDRCPNRGATVKKCGKTLKVKGGYSIFVRVDTKPVCLDTVWGPTNGTPPGNKYQVYEPGQEFVSGAA